MLSKLIEPLVRYDRSVSFLQLPDYLFAKSAERAFGVVERVVGVLRRLEAALPDDLIEGYRLDPIQDRRDEPAPKHVPTGRVAFGLVVGLDAAEGFCNHRLGPFVRLLGGSRLSR